MPSIKAALRYNRPLMEAGSATLKGDKWIAAAIQEGTLQSPCLLFDLSEVDKILALFAKHLPKVKLFYSVKANNDTTILRHLQERGIGFDVASVSELTAVLGLGVSPENVVLSNTIKNPECVRDIFRRRVPVTTVDNEYDLRALAQESLFHNFRPQILVRIKVQPVGVQINLNEKFGCSAEEAVRLLGLSRELGLPPLGIHFHVGTQCKNVLSYANGVAMAIGILERVRDEIDLDLRTINIGGGFPDAIAVGEAGGYEAYFSTLGSVVANAEEMGYTVMAEPGRVLASGACTAVAQVIGRNEHDGKQWLYLDDGIYGLFSTAHFEQRRFELAPVGEVPGEPTPFVVAGPTCDSLDVIGIDLVLPDGIRPGDYVIASHAGAYSISVKSNFNGMAQITTAVQPYAVAEITIQ